jgi:hypothetical protein
MAVKIYNKKKKSLHSLVQSLGSATVFDEEEAEKIKKISLFFTYEKDSIIWSKTGRDGVCHVLCVLLCYGGNDTINDYFGSSLKMKSKELEHY